MSKSVAISYLTRKTFSSTRFTILHWDCSKISVLSSLFESLYFLAPVLASFQCFFIDDGYLSKCWACNVIHVGPRQSDTTKNIICNERLLLPDKFVHSLLKKLKFVRDYFKQPISQSVISLIWFSLMKLLFLNNLSPHTISTHLITADVKKNSLSFSTRLSFW